MFSLAGAFSYQNFQLLTVLLKCIFMPRHWHDAGAVGGGGGGGGI